MDRHSRPESYELELDAPGFERDSITPTFHFVPSTPHAVPAARFPADADVESQRTTSVSLDRDFAGQNPGHGPLEPVREGSYGSGSGGGTRRGFGNRGRSVDTARERLNVVELETAVDANGYPPPMTVGVSKNVTVLNPEEIEVESGLALSALAIGVRLS